MLEAVAVVLARADIFPIYPVAAAVFAESVCVEYAEVMAVV